MHSRRRFSPYIIGIQSQAIDIMGKPNILLLMADQMAPGALPFYGGSTAAMTPVMSRLASEGVTFASGYCGSPLCGPSRFSLLSGQLPSRIADLDREKLLVVHCKGGYRSAIAASLLERAGFDQVINVTGGFDAWSQCQLPVMTGEPAATTV